jgi:acyl dehydratase
MALNTQAMGKTYDPLTYVIGREKIREFASAVGETNACHHDLEAARAAGYVDLVAPPMFAVVFQGRVIEPALFDPEVGINFAMLVHGSQEYRWGAPMIAGDEISTTLTVKEISERGGLGFYVMEAVSDNQRGDNACTGTWTFIVRGVS